MKLTSEGKALYTVLLDYGGGTYVAQVLARDAAHALELWTDNLLQEDLDLWRLRRDEMESLARDSFISLDGLVNVWCATGSGQLGLILINIVATLPPDETSNRTQI